MQLTRYFPARTDNYCDAINTRHRSEGNLILSSKPTYNLKNEDYFQLKDFTKQTITFS